MPRLETARLRLIPFSLLESDLFLSINTSPFVRQYLWDDEIISEAVAKAVMDKNAASFQEAGHGLWKILLRPKQEVIGYTGLWYFFEEKQPQLVYVLREAYTAKGYATEAALAVIDYAFEQLHFPYLIAAMDKPHLASQRLARRLGMELVAEEMEDDKATLFYRIERA